MKHLVQNHGQTDHTIILPDGAEKVIRPGQGEVLDIRVSEANRHEGAKGLRITRQEPATKAEEDQPAPAPKAKRPARAKPKAKAAVPTPAESEAPAPEAPAE